MRGIAPYVRRDMNLFRMMDEMERSFFDNSVGGIAQFRCDISDKGDHFMLEAELPGFAKEDIRIELDGDTLLISASNESKNDEVDKDGNYVRRERRFGSFSRSFDVSGIDTEHIKADYANGMLELSLPKIREAEAKARRIEIGAGSETQSPQG